MEEEEGVRGKERTVIGKGRVGCHSFVSIFIEKCCLQFCVFICKLGCVLFRLCKVKNKYGMRSLDLVIWP